jgi:hypothetical protein
MRHGLAWPGLAWPGLAWLWLLVGLVLAALLLVARRMDAELVNPVADDYSWTSWSRRNRR